MPVRGRKEIMNIGYRLLICLGIVAIHFAAFVVPVTELFLIYIILFNPRWFRDFLDSTNAP
jgi:hypothetical protein